MSLTEQIVLNKKGKPVAVQIPMNQYKKLLDLAEEMEDIKAYDQAMKRKHQFIPFDKMVKEELGSTLTSPFMTLSVMALLVIPHLKLSDKGLFDGDSFSFVQS